MADSIEEEDGAGGVPRELELSDGSRLVLEGAGEAGRSRCGGKSAEVISLGSAMTLVGPFAGYVRVDAGSAPGGGGAGESGGELEDRAA
jgi:hypothetical protein